MPKNAAMMANIVKGQKYFFTILLAIPWNRYSRYPTIANRAVRNIADTPMNISAGKFKNPAQIAINLYGTGVTAAKTIINIPCLANIAWAVANCSGLDTLFINQMPTESNNHNPIIYAIAPPTSDPNAAATTIGKARFLLAMIGGVINTSGGMNKNTDSQTVKKNTTQLKQGCSAYFNIQLASFDCFSFFMNSIVIQYSMIYNRNMKKQMNYSRKERIAAKVQTIVGEILLEKFMDDPILSGVSLVGSESHGGLNYVKLFYYTRNADRAAVQKRLDQVNGMIRFDLATRMDQKYVPDIRFAYDDTLEKAQRIDELLAKIGE